MFLDVQNIFHAEDIPDWILLQKNISRSKNWSKSPHFLHPKTLFWKRSEQFRGAPQKNFFPHGTDDPKKSWGFREVFGMVFGRFSWWFSWQFSGRFFLAFFVTIFMMALVAVFVTAFTTDALPLIAILVKGLPWNTHQLGPASLPPTMKYLQVLT